MIAPSWIRFGRRERARHGRRRREWRRRRRDRLQRKTRTIATFPQGPNPIAPIPTLPERTERTPAPRPGLYLNDDRTGYTYLVPAAALARYAGDVIVGTEARPHFWALTARGNGFAKIPLRDNLPAGTYSLKQAIFVSS